MKICEHIDSNNERDCKNKAEYICMCCSAFVCFEHKDTRCPYGDMGYTEL